MKESEVLENILANCEENIISYKNALAKISDRFFLIRLLNQILSDSKLLSGIAKRSYYHWNGFYKIVLYSSDAKKLRLHVWPILLKENNSLENIHYHRWSFVSKILLGGYSNYDYEISEEGTLMEKYIYAPRLGRDIYKLKKVGTEKLKLVKTTILRENDFIVSQPFQLHRVISLGNALTASILIQGKDELSSTAIYSENNVEEYVESPCLDDKELEDILILFINAFKMEL